MYNAPLFPELDVPVLNTIWPLTPDVPAFDVTNRSDPLELDEPYPVSTDTRPPDDVDEDMPAEMVISPPVPLLPDPTEI